MSTPHTRTAARCKQLPLVTLIALSAGIHSATQAQETESARALEEIVVTAQRRSESMQDVAVAVTAVSEDQMEMAGVESVANLQAVSPSINFTSSNSPANTANILIRGIGTVGNTRSFEGAVGVFIDGVYRTRAGQAMSNWLDIESLQILRGPQGTLFGKNTSAGALLISSTAPDTAESGGDIKASLGNYGKSLVKARYNYAISDTSAFRIAGLWGEQDGFIENPDGGNYNESAPRSLKAQYLYQPSDQFEMHLIADWSESESNCCYGQVGDVLGASQAIIDGLILAQGLQLPSSDFTDYQTVLSNDTDQDLEDKGLVLKLGWVTDSGLEINSITAYREWFISQVGMDADFSGANILTINESFASEVFSQEVTLAGDIENGFGPFQSADYLVGAYYSDEDINAEHQLLWGNQAQFYWDILGAVAGLPAGTIDASEGLWADHTMPASSQSSAIFTHWNFDINDKLGLTMGLRYSEDEKRGALQRNFFAAGPFVAFRLQGVQPGPTYDADFSDSAVTGNLALRYHLNDDVMLYGSYSRGYKSGGVNIDNTAAGSVNDNPEEFTCGFATPVKPAGDCTPNDPRYDSEFVDGYELGLKSDFWNNRARVNLALFYNEIENLQIATFTGLQFVVLNGPESTVRGLELESTFLLNDNLTLSFDATWLDEARYGFSADPNIAAFSDSDFSRAPDLAANLSLLGEYQLTSNWNLTGRVAAIYSGSQTTAPASFLERDSQTTFDLNLGLSSDDLGLDIMLWCQNCSDERYPDQYFIAPLRTDTQNAYVAAPRTYGITLSKDF